MQYILKTERFYLRRFIPDDAKHIYALHADPEIMFFTADTPFVSVQEARNFIKSYPYYKRDGFGRWAVIPIRNQNMIGWCGLQYNELHLVDLSFRFFKKFWNQGIATEVATACLNYGLHVLKLQRIVARVHADHLASIRVIQKLGMKYYTTDKCRGVSGFLYFETTN